MDRIQAWERGEKIAPITIDMALTRACNYACYFCYAMLQENDRKVINKKVIFDFLEDAAVQLQFLHCEYFERAEAM